MHVEVRLYGDLRKYAPEGTRAEWKGNIPDNSRVIELIRLLGVPEKHPLVSFY